jgi:hypothetical protein
MRRPDSHYGGVSRSQCFGSIAVIFSILRKGTFERVGVQSPVADGSDALP